jgi:hypothetical protein
MVTKNLWILLAIWADCTVIKSPVNEPVVGDWSYLSTRAGGRGLAEVIEDSVGYCLGYSALEVGVF